MVETRNDKTITVKVTRRELCDLILSCTAYNFYDGTKWKSLHDKLKSQLDDFDKRFDN